MNRRDLLRQTSAAALGALAAPAALASPASASPASASPASASPASVSPASAPRSAPRGTDGKVLNAYYFRAHMYTCVPAHVRHDMETMAAWGTTHITIAVLEQDFRAAHHNVDLVCAEAARVGMKVLAVPSRWCGLFAGAPKVPSEFAAEYPETWATRNRAGDPLISGPSGPICSVFHPRVRDYLLGLTEELVTRFDIAGIVMDEPKKIHRKDYSEHALAAVGADASRLEHVAAKVAFFDEMGRTMKAARPDATLGLFVHASKAGDHDDVIDLLAAMPSLDAFGADGRPWDVDATTERNWNRKCLFPTNVDTFLAAAARHGKRTLVLAENYDLPMRHLDLFDAGMPRLLALGLDELLYYYYPRNIEDPEAQMAVVARHVQQFA
ncbi:MAG: hypothetical protein AAF594_02070 [Bacteroidota bacterium]